MGRAAYRVLVRGTVAREVGVAVVVAHEADDLASGQLCDLLAELGCMTRGVMNNRDAGSSCANQTVARNFEDILLHDWEHLARQQAVYD